MRISFSVFFLFLYFVKTCRSRDVLPVHIPEYCKKMQLQEPINNQKIITINNKKSMYPLGIHLPIFQEYNLRPVVNFYTPIVSTKLHTYINLISEILPKRKREALYEQVNVNLEDNSKGGKFETVDCNIDKVLKFEKDDDSLNRTIPKKNVKANSEEHEEPRKDFNKTIPEDLVNKSKILKETNKKDQTNKDNNNKESLNKNEIFANNCSKNNSTKDVNNSRSYEQDTNQKSNIEIVINHDTNTEDQDANIIIHSNEYCEFISGANNKIPDFSFENPLDPTFTVRKVIPYDYGQFTRNQYTRTLSDEENYANIYQLGTVTKQNNKYPYYDCTQLETNILPNRINSNERKVAVNDYSNFKNIWRSSKNTNVIIKNKPKNIKLFLNYGSSGNKKFNQPSLIYSHSDYRNLNNLKAYYPRYVYNCI